MSTATRALTPADLDQLLEDARSFNQSVEVTGALLFNTDTFFQYIEGPAVGLAQVYSRITGSQAHHRIYEVFRGTTLVRLFPDWHMGFADAPKSELQRIAQSNWQASIASLPNDLRQGEGARLLLGFWSKAYRP